MLVKDKSLVWCVQTVLGRPTPTRGHDTHNFLIRATVPNDVPVDRKDSGTEGVVQTNGELEMGSLE